MLTCEIRQGFRPAAWDQGGLDSYLAHTLTWIKTLSLAGMPAWPMLCRQADNQQGDPPGRAEVGVPGYLSRGAPVLGVWPANRKVQDLPGCMCLFLAMRFLVCP